MLESGHANDAAGALPRRDLLKLSAGALAGVALAGCASRTRDAELMRSPLPAQALVAPPMQRVRIGFVGVGGMGSNHVNQLLHVPGAEIVAVCDIVPEKVRHTQDLIEKEGRARPAGFDRGPQDFRRLCETVDCDLVFTATPWEWHVPVCLAAMQSGKHAATEVPAAYTVEGCWALVEAAEKHERHCVMMENCCYDRTELLFLSMIRRGLLGEVLHAACGYLHDLRDVKFGRDGEGLWRRAHATTRNGNLYPTHGIGPVAHYMNINRGDAFDYLVSMSGPSRGLQLWQQEHLERDDPRRREQYVLGDVNSTLIRTKLGRTIHLVHDTNLPRPYSRINFVQGTRGVLADYPPKVHIEGLSPQHAWEEAEQYAGEYEHPLWRSERVKSASGGHGGMDYLENYRLIRCLLEGRPTDMDVYDAAAWSVLCACTEQSAGHRSAPVDIPDFTRGAWKTRAPWPIVD